MDTEGQAPTNPMNGGTGDKRKGLFYHNIAPNGVGTASTGTVLYVNRLFRGFNRLFRRTVLYVAEKRRREEQHTELCCTVL